MFRGANLYSPALFNRRSVQQRHPHVQQVDLLKSLMMESGTLVEKDVSNLPPVNVEAARQVGDSCRPKAS